MNEIFGLSGKAAFISGAGSGIGLATSRLLLSMGMKVAMVDKDERALKEAEKELSVSHGEERVRTFVADVTDREEVGKAATEACQWSGGIQTLITSAGIVRKDGGNAYQDVFGVNVQGTMNSVEALRENFETRRSGTIVMIGSIVASQGWPERVVYCASKGAVEAAMRAYAMEFARFGVRVNALAPGLVWTPLIKAVVKADQDPEQAFRFRSAQQALGVMLNPEQVAGHILFLASELSAGILGCTVDASGGRLSGHTPDTKQPGPLFDGRWAELKEEVLT